MIKNVIIAGVGGQGTIFAGKILGTMASVSYTHLDVYKRQLLTRITRLLVTSS